MGNWYTDYQYNHNQYHTSQCKTLVMSSQPPHPQSQPQPKKPQKQQMPQKNTSHTQSTYSSLGSCTKYCNSPCTNRLYLTCLSIWRELMLSGTPSSLETTLLGQWMRLAILTFYSQGECCARGCSLCGSGVSVFWRCVKLGAWAVVVAVVVVIECSVGCNSRGGYIENGLLQRHAILTSRQPSLQKALGSVDGVEGPHPSLFGCRSTSPQIFKNPLTFSGIPCPRLMEYDSANDESALKENSPLSFATNSLNWEYITNCLSTADNA